MKTMERGNIYMGSYAYISIIALGCYSFLFLAFMAAKKTKTIRSFVIVLMVFLLWTGGSLFMRMMMWPSIEFWFHLSIVGLMFLPFAFFNFVHAFVESKDYRFWKIWLLITIVNNIVNIVWQIYIPCPKIVELAGGEVSFQYDIPWTIVLLFASAGAMVLHMFILLLKNIKKDVVTARQFRPIFCGILILFIGHILTLVPFFKGFPTDVLSGVINAFFMFYALYKQRLFKLTLLVSRGVIYGTATLISIIIFSNFVNPLAYFLNDKMGILNDNETLVIAFLFTAATLILSGVIKSFIDILFTKDETMQAEILKEFSLAVSMSLKIDDIMNNLVDVIHKTIDVEKVYVCVPDKNKKEFTILHSTSLLGGKTIKLGVDNPAINWLIKNNKCILMNDFERSVYYKSMWEVEKQQLRDLKIQCIAPLKDGDELVGIILLSNKIRNKTFSYDDINILDSVNSIGSIAIKNSRLYEKTYLEARTDDLTGLLNRKYFYETLVEEQKKCENSSLALIFIDIDDFKLYNQLYGLREGDNALRAVARIIQNCVGENGFVSRNNGKEFAIILPRYDVLGAKALAESISCQIRSMNKKDKNYSLKILTASIGICAIPYCASNIKELIENVDMAVFKVKHSGKNGIFVYEAGEIEVMNNGDNNAKKNAYLEYAPTIFALTAAIDTKDHYTFNHSKNVAYYATELAKASGMNSDFVEIVYEAGLLHDIGKIGIPENILNKPGKLTREEYEVVQTHVEHSIGIIRNLPSLDYVIPAVIGHHERYDGQGYPRGISGEDIPISARMLCIADSFDAMVSNRSYKHPFSVEYALEELDRQAGKQFDVNLAMTFIDLVKNDMVKVQYDKEETLTEGNIH